MTKRRSEIPMIHEDPSHSLKLMHIIKVFEQQNPHPKIELVYTNPFTLVVAVLLSAQATDKLVNRVTHDLFQMIHTPEDVVAMGLNALTEAVRRINYYRNKAKYIFALSQKLIEHHQSIVPNTREALMTLPGIGRKSANVILGALYDKPYIPVDTHVFRVTQRIGICKGKTPEEIEQQLDRLTPDAYKSRIGGWFVLHGRYICKAKNPLCNTCPLKAWCDYYHTVVKG